VGGLENFKEELIDKKDIFTQEWREYYGDDFITAMMVVGQPGTGKTLTAKATRSIFNIPLLRLEAGRLFGSLVGQSESNYRTAIGTAKAIAPCILWVDEIDGLFSGAESSGRTDGGTTDRIIKAFLQDMQEVKGVLWFFTCNDIDKLPDPLIDRCEVWSVDLPNREERKAILSIHIAKRKRNPAKFNLDTIAEALEGFSGRQIERAWLNAMAAAFNDGKREPKNADLIDAAKKFTPTSITMRDAIERRRARLVNRARQASRSDAPVTEGRIRKIA
jgi:SpoVK/Ycf46/Vps4 family AAA+-type ATPase